jgi:hypothetical protein
VFYLSVMPDWERIPPEEVQVGDRIEVRGDMAEVTGIVHDEDSTRLLVTIHKPMPDGPDYLITGAYTPTGSHVLRVPS